MLLVRERKRNSTLVSPADESYKERRSSRVSKDRIVLTQETLLVAVKDSRPSVSEEERKKYSRM